jgi:hypothetical protein
MAMSTQKTADRKNHRGWGKNETNMEGDSFSRGECSKAALRHVNSR